MSFFLTLLVLPIRTWLVMIVFGIIHSEFIPQIPAFGFWQSLVIVILVQMMSAPVKVKVTFKK